MSGNNVNVAGFGSVAAGTYGKVTINGAGTVSGPVTCDSLTVNGAGTFEGDVTADSVTVNGTATFRSQIHVGTMDVNGECSVTYGAGIGALRVRGRLTIGGGLAANTVSVRGHLGVGEACEADAFNASGVFTIGGGLQARDVEVRLYGTCRAREIGADNVVVREERATFDIGTLFGLFGDRRLYTDTIEADKIAVEYTTAKKLRGTDVDLGPGCDIEVVEYAGDLRQGAGAKVGSAVKIPGGGQA